MPFKSEAQRRFMYSQHPAIAKRWSQEYPTQKQLPAHASAGREKVAQALMRRHKP